MKRNELFEMLDKYLELLSCEEKSLLTISKYKRDIIKFLKAINSENITKECSLSFKSEIMTSHKTSSVNSMLTAVNGFLAFCGLGDMKVKLLKVQREIFVNPEKELTKSEYERLVKAAEKKENRQLALLIQTICACGIRVSELQFLTVSGVHARQMTVACKNKKRKVLLPSELCKKLITYCKGKDIQNGIIFRTKNGKPLDRSNIWKMMKNLCKTAGVAKTKVFPHNLRHLFARTYYKLEKDISRLADILGHSNINTTRIYTIESGKIHQMQINKMALIL